MPIPASTQEGATWSGCSPVGPRTCRRTLRPQRVRVSQGVTSGLLMKEVKPEYPPLARQARIQGTVVLHAIIDKDGSVQNLQVISGHLILTPAAIQAVKQWK